MFSDERRIKESFQVEQRQAKAVVVRSVAVIGKMLSESPLNSETVILSSVAVEGWRSETNPGEGTEGG